MAIKIISLPVDDGGCGWYRIRQPYEMIQRFTEHDTHIVDVTKDNMLAVAKAFEVADVAVVRQGGEVGIDMLRQKYAHRDFKWVMDIDDNIELISPYSNHYLEYGQDEVQHQGKWLWRDGQEGFDLTKNHKRLANLLEGMQKVDLVTVTTPKLAEYARQYNSNVAILPNCVNLDRWWKLPLKPNQQLRIGWSGGSSHYDDWYSIKQPLNALMRKYQFKLVMIGHAFPGIIDADNQHLVETMDWVPFKGHSYRTMCAALDIAIIPLADIPFNTYKSAIKWYEMSAAGIPSVIANVTPYKEEISPETAVAYSDHQGFEQGLEMLLLDPQKRLQIGEKAREWVVANRSAKDTAEEWVKAYKGILTQK